MRHEVGGLYLRALEEQQVEWEAADASLGPNSALLELHQQATSDDLAALWAEFADGDEDQRILLARVCGEATAALPASVRNGLLAWLEQPVEPPLLTWVVSRLAYLPDPLGDVLHPALRHLAHPDDEVRYALTGLLTGYVPDPVAVDGLVALGNDEVADVRFGAIFELQAHVDEAGLCDPRVEALLRRAGADPDDRIRHVVSAG